MNTTEARLVWVVECECGESQVIDFDGRDIVTVKCEECNEIFRVRKGERCADD